METWAIITLVLGSNAISIIGTFLVTKMQVAHSDKRLDREIQRVVEADYRNRRREVRSEPLIKLRIELAHMANKQDKLVAAASRQHTRFGGTDEDTRKELQEAVDDWNNYLAIGDFAQTLYIQYDTDLVKKAEDIRRDYQKSFFYHLHFQDIDGEQLLEAMKIFEENRNRIIEVQDLINKRLEEL
jgi:hypothetical protein